MDKCKKKLRRMRLLGLSRFIPSKRKSKKVRKRSFIKVMTTMFRVGLNVKNVKSGERPQKTSARMTSSNARDPTRNAIVNNVWPRTILPFDHMFDYFSVGWNVYVKFIKKIKYYFYDFM
jgi:hypothetical protein